MKNLQEIARRVRRPEDQLRFPCELLQQGYEPNYLANYRPDELGNFDELTLSTLKRTLQQFEALETHRAKALAGLEKDSLSSDAIVEIVQEASSIAEIDTTLRHVRARKNAKSIAEKNPTVQTLGQAILTLQGEPPADFSAWVAETAGVPADQVDDLIAQTKLWLAHMLSEDLGLMRELQQYVLRKGTASVKILPEPPKGSDAEKRLEASDDTHSGEILEVAASEEAAPVAADSTDVAETGVAETDAPKAEAAETTTAEAVTEPESTQPEGESAQAPSSTDELASSVDSEVAPLIAEFNQGKKTSKPIKTKSLSEKQLSPRQRRRRWLRSILESYARLKKPVGNITPYQILMLARGLRSQIIQLNIDYDKKPLVQMCRDALCSGRHPLHAFLIEVSESSLKDFLLPRVHQDVMAILEEYANEELTESAVAHLQSSLLQRPIRGHRILVIDAIGPKMAAAAIVDADGEIVFTGELPCNSNRADIVAQNVVTLGTWVHEHRVTLISLSNGPARRYLVQPIAELLRQSSEGSLYWTMVDRAGADGYCNSRICLVELPNISRRHRAAVWLARRLQDPLKQILKVDPSRLRLGSYQRELPQAALELALRDAVSSAISRSGLDVYRTEPEVLQRAPGMTLAAAKAVAQACREEKITNRESLLAVLKEHLSESQARQAIGFLRVYGSEIAFDATSIHPDDYRLASRLIEHASLPTPPAAPEGWSKPDYQEIAAAADAAERAFEKQQAEFGASIDLNPDSADESEEDQQDQEAASSFGDLSQVIEDESDTVAQEPAAEPVTPASQDVETQTSTSELEAAPAEAAAEASTDSESGSSISADEAAVNDESNQSAPSSDESEPSVPADTADATASESVAAGANLPPLETKPQSRVPLTIDVERLARSWQVGREKLRRVAYSLQSPFEDDRDYQYPLPLISKLPKLDSLKPGDLLQALVVGVTDFGVFVDLGPDCSGLIHISRITPNYVEDPHQYVQMGDLLTVWVVSIDEKRKRVALTAIPPGTATRRDAGEGRSSEARTSESRGNDRRPNAGDRSGAARGQARNDRGGPRSGTGRDGGGRDGAGRGRGDSGRGNARGGNDRNRNDRGRGRDGQNEGGNRRPVRVEAPKPVTPITDAMQQGKEPLRSFSDLMQFMKKPKPENEIVSDSAKPTTQEPSSAPATDAPAQPGPADTANESSSEQNA